jgi:mono/diheme cytochrome c family protein
MSNRGVLLLLVASSVGAQTQISAPRIWNDRDLAEWATPVAALKVRPGHLTEKEYYSIPSGEWVRTYPVYFPGREPKGYWEMLQSKKPEPLISPGARSEAEWVEAGRQAFEELDVPGFRTKDPRVIAKIRSAEAFTKLEGHPQKDGVVLGWRWVPTSTGLTLSSQECAGCHTRVMPDGSRLYGAQGNDAGDDLFFEVLQAANEFFLPGDSQALATWRGFAVPWIANDIHDQIKSMKWPEIVALTKSNPSGTIARFNGSPWHPTPISDLIGVKDRKYLDYNATHRQRGPEDIARYAILVACCDSADFGPHHILTDKQRIPPYRMPDELAFALGKYIYSLQPPKNPNARDSRAAVGKKVFDREGCGGCHQAPLYTNNKLTLATGWVPPKDHPYRPDMMLFSVGTEPVATLETRKGTGVYRVPSLRGLWYRDLLSHDGSVASLEAWFDPARLREDYVPKGFKGYKVEHRAVPGHEYGLKLPSDEKASLIAFLRTL